METIIKNGLLINPASGEERSADLRLEDGRISEIRPKMRVRNGVEVIDASGLWVLPGLIDMHTHLREPGGEQKETIRSGTLAAAAGGFTSIVCMANTSPVNDSASVTRFIRSQIEREAHVNVYPVGAATRQLEGKALADIGEMAQYGIVAVSDDGHCIRDARMMRKVLEYAKTFGLPVIVHAEDPSFAGYPGVHEGEVATQLGLQGSPATAEAIMVARDCAIAALTRAHLHVAHLTSSEALDIIRQAKARGISVSCEVTPHHLLLTEEAILGFSTDAKVNPPLRTEQDRQALLKGLREGVIDVVATDHAPHGRTDKEVSFDCAASGMVGLETTLALLWTEREQIGLGVLDFFATLTSRPARLLSLDGKGRLEVGADADVVLFDAEAAWVIDPTRFYSKSQNTPFAGREVKGKVMKTIVGGEVVYE
jgi:dihydroorotase